MVCAGSFGFGATCLSAAGWQSFTEKSSKLGGDLITSMAVCSNNQVLFAHTSGISRWDGTKWTQVAEPAASSIDAMVCDAQGGVWAAHFKGVSHFTGGKWTTYGADKLATGAATNELLKDIVVAPDGKVWAATSQSVASFDGTTWTVYQQGQGFDKKLFFSKLAVDGQGHVWAVHSGGLTMWDGKTWTDYDNPNFVVPEALAIDPKGRVWVGTFANGVNVFDNGSWEAYDTAELAKASKHVYAIAFDAEGRAWLGTAYGLVTYDGDTWKTYRMDTADLADNDLRHVIARGGGVKLPQPKAKATGSLTGRVLQEDQTPLANAAVEVCVEKIAFSYNGATPCSDQPFMQAAKTDAKGNFTISDVPPGRYVVTMETAPGKWAQLTGDFSLGESALVESGEKTDLETLTIQPKKE